MQRLAERINLSTGLADTLGPAVAPASGAALTPSQAPASGAASTLSQAPAGGTSAVSTAGRIHCLPFLKLAIPHPALS